MSWLGSLYGADELQTQGDALDAKLKVLNDKALASGRWDQVTYDQAEKNRLGGATGNVDQEIDQAFKEGWDQGFDNVTSGIRSGLSTAVSFPTKFILSSIPWWFWLVGALLLALKFNLIKWRKA